jgi:hypothetical protein
MDRYLRCRLTRSIIFQNQSPTTAAPPTPIGDGTHNTLLTVHHDEDHTLCIHAFITGLEAGPYAYGYSSPPRKSKVAPSGAFRLVTYDPL